MLLAAADAGRSPGLGERPRVGDDGADMTLLDRLPATPADPDALFETFEAWAAEQGLTLYPAQEEALIEVVTGSNVILSTPTGTGKSLVAIGAHFAALAQGRRTSTPPRSRRWSRRSSSP